MSGGEYGRVVAQTQDWIERLVIGLGLCPFAAAPYRQGRITYSVCDADSIEGIYQAFLQSLETFVQADPVEQETALLIVSRGLTEFDDYLDALSLLEQAVAEAGLDGVFHCCGADPVGRMELAHLACEVFELDAGLLRSAPPQDDVLPGVPIPYDTTIVRPRTTELLGREPTSIRPLLERFRQEYEAAV